MTASRVDAADEAIIFETLKQRRKQIFRAVPVPRALIPLLTTYGVGNEGRLWPWGRTHGWKVIKSVMHKAGITETLCKPKALRHAFAVEAGQKGIPLNIVQRWLGHARIETTAIYASAIGDEERNLARRAWSSLELAIPKGDVSDLIAPPGQSCSCARFIADPLGKLKQEVSVDELRQRLLRVRRSSECYFSL